MACSVVGLLGPSLKHSLASRSRLGDPLPFANSARRRRASRSIPQDSLVSCSRPGNPPPFVNGARRHRASRSVPQAFPCVLLAPRRPAALRKWRAASPGISVRPSSILWCPAHAPATRRPS
ncbi:hypothetical protein K488DRAFT_92898 [Vararia minispora EC-137]|uniref:Uncharacterized protein n=1 Tax=Vararia minispora EC-137 TaxID=1314806 RepID=A0ACB8Q3R1_9AGAM|nr:hypothetical protein K488DRAFT_92898 [Vararia minispora EC-137]